MTDGCVTCELGVRRRAGAAPVWDNILATPSWDVAHAFGTDIEGWCVVVARRHITSLAQLTDEESRELGPLVRDLSAVLQDLVGCAKTYLAQFAEHPDHPHVHLHLIPRPVDLADEQRGPGVFGRLGLPEDQWVPEARRNGLALHIRGRLGDRWNEGGAPRAGRP